MMKRLVTCFAWVAAMIVTLGAVPTVSASSVRTVDLAAEASCVKLLGRTTVEDYGIEPHSTGAGIAFYAECSGDITLAMTGAPSKFESLYVAVFVDDVLQRVEFTGQIGRRHTEELVIARDLPQGKHKIEIVRETEENYGRYIWTSISLNGTITPVENAPLLIEFVGDSITAGYASYPQTEENESLSVEHPVFMAGVKSYAYLTAQALNADFQSVCASGYGVVRGYNSDGVTLPMMYDYAGYYHNKGKSGIWAFERPADIVVIHLGANDSDRGTTLEEMATGAKTFMESVRSRNPDAAIVWVTGETYRKFEQQLEQAVQELGGAEKGFYYTVLPEGTSGGAGHPNLEEHAVTADALVQFLKENVLPSATPSALWVTLGVIGGIAMLAVLALIVFKFKRTVG